MDFMGKKVLVIGVGISGNAVAKIAKKMGADVTLSDSKAEADITYDLQELRDAGVKLVFGKQDSTQLEGVDLVILSPAVPVRIPLVQEAYKRNIPVTSEVEVAYELAKSPIFAVTGTNGKTTTVTLLGQLMRTRYPNAGVGGNIGIPLCEEALKAGENSCVVAEISSYQMEASTKFRPHVAVELNVTPDHVVRHGSLEVYQQMKEKMFANQDSSDYLVLNYDNDKTRDMANRAKSRVFFFSRKEVLKEGAFLNDGWLTIAWQGQTCKLCRADELKIKGGHNVENALAAAAAAFLGGVRIPKITETLKAFEPVEHRIEPVATVNGVPYYNDSKATNTDSSIKALDSFDGHLILIAGGDDKHTDLSEFMALVKEKVDELILVGDATERFKQEALAAGYPQEHIHEAGYSMEKAVEIAHEISGIPQIVLLSPACASFDMYTGYEERGRDFKHLVKELLK
ncbi:MAG: UDP-N-acetylmuramoyl-L-alanine--D-glutamate ligase [Anaerovibrio sp.]|uniref:UDP-N-acetylmuramoyl-L-alanine--D-glutamate ligase n=1 Tax=Anaerovibrio sp. TaxID=1872532 RepID=UPI0026000F84|nr:UDP-N-acetylmuramoyl-L-alanine--D-glutamate ligase [Anaerovibrio sp.]MCR5175400.1 UDP-N-acetylmuramoyl-L-alanine--D-glutamate ligase [Anaerovibrio sp.]